MDAEVRRSLEGSERRVPGGHCRRMDAEVRRSLEGSERRVPGGHCRRMDAEVRRSLEGSERRVPGGHCRRMDAEASKSAESKSIAQTGSAEPEMSIAQTGPAGQEESRYVTAAERCEAYTGECGNCGIGYNLEYDHIVKFSHGGANTASNLQMLCRACNGRKEIRARASGFFG